MSKCKEVEVVGEPQLVTLGPWTIAEVTDGSVKGYGASHKSKLDRYNYQLGVDIAIGRAKKDLFNKKNNVRKRTQSVFVG